MSRDFPTSPKFSAQTTMALCEWAMKAVPTKAQAWVMDATAYSKEERKLTQ
jgi:hypothetical protein